MALQPSLGHYYARVNEEWRKGYEVQTSQTGRYASDPPLSRIVVVSISGGIHDYQVFVCLFFYILYWITALLWIFVGIHDYLALFVLFRILCCDYCCIAVESPSCMSK